MEDFDISKLTENELLIHNFLLSYQQDLIQLHKKYEKESLELFTNKHINYEEYKEVKSEMKMYMVIIGKSMHE